MSFGTENPGLEGILRALQGNMMGLVGSLVFILIVVLVINAFIRRSESTNDLPSSDAKQARSWVRFFGGIAALLTVAGFVVNAAFFAAANYTPRVDIDKSGVYEQMQRNTQPPSK